MRININMPDDNKLNDIISLLKEQKAFLIGIHVDLVIKKSLLPHIGKNILDEVIYV
ncbi:MAG: hypothetical protein L0Y73_09110 [Candidatus Aminicenantes bacterium]|nr:hypothetical protein [Candidatus Aminicenantes bacterium]